MTILNSQGMSGSQVKSNAINLLKQHRAILSQLNDYYLWSSGVAASDLTTAWPNDFDTPTANGLLSAIADAHAEYQIHMTGQAPSTYPQVPTTAPGPYVYAASQNALIGPNIA